MRSPQLQALCDTFAKIAFKWDGNPQHCKFCNTQEDPDGLIAAGPGYVKEWNISQMCRTCQDRMFG
jgi:hypothetical protein